MNAPQSMNEFLPEIDHTTLHSSLKTGDLIDV